MNPELPRNPHPDPAFGETSEATVESAVQTLRLLAQLTPPEDLPGRVRARVLRQMAQNNAASRGSSFWSYWSPARRFQFAGAAALVLAVSTWTVYRPHPAANSTTAPAISAAPGAGSFGSAKAERIPPSLKPILVPNAAAKPAPLPAHGRKKPSAGKSLLKSPPAQDLNETPAKP